MPAVPRLLVVGPDERILGRLIGDPRGFGGADCAVALDDADLASAEAPRFDVVAVDLAGEPYDSWFTVARIAGLASRPLIVAIGEPSQWARALRLGADAAVSYEGPLASVIATMLGEMERVCFLS